MIALQRVSIFEIIDKKTNDNGDAHHYVLDILLIVLSPYRYELSRNTDQEKRGILIDVYCYFSSEDPTEI